MSGFYFKTENNCYFYDNSTGKVQISSGSNDRAIIFDQKPFDMAMERRDMTRYLHSIPAPHLILLVTEQCNLRCKYCAYSGIYTNQRTHSDKNMSKETAQKAIDNYFIFFRNVKNVNVTAQPTIAFYGGEPLMNFDVIKFAIDYAKNIYHGEIVFSITTNAILLTEKIIDYFVENEVGLVISLNGSKAEHDRSRIFPNGQGTFDIVMKKIDYIHDKKIDYFGKKFAISATIDTGTDLIEFDDFFSTSKFKKTPISVSQVKKDYSGWYNQFNEKDKDRYIAQIEFLRHKFYESKVTGEWCGNIKNGLFNPVILLILSRCIGSIRSLVPFTCACIPGMKIAVDCDGSIHICEKVNNSRPIGHVDTWIDYELVYNLLETYVETLGKNCFNCPANRVCSICYKDVFDSDGNGRAPDVNWCRKYVNLVQDNFEMIYSLMESGVTMTELLRV
jgi:uncharacterized protein